MKTKQMTTLDIHHKKKISDFEHNEKKIRKNGQNKKNSTKYKLKLIKEKKSKYFLLVMDILISYYDETPLEYKSLPLSDDKELFKNIKYKKENGKKTLNDFVNKKSKKNKGNLYNEYLYRLQYKDKSIKIKNNINIQHFKEKRSICSDCKMNMYVDLFSSMYICKNCNSVSKFFIETDKIPYVNEALIEGNHFSYRRYDHFIDWLSKFQKNKKSKIPKSIFTLINKELNRIKHKDKRNINKETILQILKKTGNTKYNNLIHEITNKINNKPIPRLPIIIQEKMKMMFKKTQKPFEEVCPKTRTNFLSYSYVIRKFLEILNQHKYIEYFPLLKSKEKLYSQDMIWKKMCQKLNWEYNPSI